MRYIPLVNVQVKGVQGVWHVMRTWFYLWNMCAQFHKHMNTLISMIVLHFTPQVRDGWVGTLCIGDNKQFLWWKDRRLWKVALHSTVLCAWDLIILFGFGLPGPCADSSVDCQWLFVHFWPGFFHIDILFNDFTLCHVCQSIWTGLHCGVDTVVPSCVTFGFILKLLFELQRTWTHLQLHACSSPVLWFRLIAVTLPWALRPSG